MEERSFEPVAEPDVDRMRVREIAHADLAQQRVQLGFPVIEGAVAFVLLLAARRVLLLVGARAAPIFPATSSGSRSGCMI